MKRLNKVNLIWSAQLAYAIGLIVTDGSLSIDGRHIDSTSKDRELVMLLKRCLTIQNKIGKKTRGGEQEEKYYRVQFGDKNFYEFLLSIGLMHAKSKKLGQVKIPNRNFADFLRGCIDGDGNINTFRHPESSHIQLRVRVASASKEFLEWLHRKNQQIIDLQGGWIEQNQGVFILTYGKLDAIKLLQFIYYSRDVFCLERRYITAHKFLDL